MYNVFDLNNLISRNASSFSSTESIAAREKCFYGSANMSVLYSNGNSTFANNSLGLCNNLKAIVLKNRKYDTIWTTFSDIPDFRVCGSYWLSSRYDGKTEYTFDTNMHFLTSTNFILVNDGVKKLELTLTGEYRKMTSNVLVTCSYDYINNSITVSSNKNTKKTGTIFNLRYYRYLSSTAITSKEATGYLSVSAGSTSQLKNLRLNFGYTINSYPVRLPTYEWNSSILYDYASSTMATSASEFPIHLSFTEYDTGQYSFYYTSTRYKSDTFIPHYRFNDFAEALYDFGSTTVNPTFASITFSSTPDNNLKSTPFIVFSTNSSYDNDDDFKSISTCEIISNKTNISIARRNSQNQYCKMLIADNSYITNFSFSNSSSTTANAANIVSVNTYYCDNEEPWYGIAASYGFYNGNKLSSAFFGSISGIGDYCFYNCTNLKECSFSMLDEEKIGNYAFYGCINLTDINGIDLASINGSVGSYAFYNCSSIEEIDVYGNYISSYAFKNCYSVKNLYATVYGSIGKNAFENCSSLEYVSINLYFDNGSLLSDAFKNCNSILSANILFYGKTCNIATSSFANSKSLEYAEITFQDDSCTLGTYSFANCSALNYVKISSTTNSISSTIGAYAFYNCSSLENVDMKIDSSTTFGNYAFANCSSLNSFYFNTNSPVKFGTGILSGCGITKIHPRSSYAIPHISSMEFGGNIPSYGLSHSILLYEVNMEGVSSIGTYAFANCSELTSFAVSSYCLSSTDTEETWGIRNMTIGSNALSGCSNLKFESSFRKVFDEDDLMVPGMVMLSSANMASLSSGLPWGAKNAVFVLNLKDDDIVYDDVTNTVTITSAFNSSKQLTSIIYDWA